MATNAAVVLMFVFWYCWKRGREVRLAKEAVVEGEDSEGEDVLEVDVTDEEDEEVLDELEKEIEKQGDSLSQPTPAEVPVSDPVEGVAVVDEGIGETDEPAEKTQEGGDAEAEKSAPA